MNLHFIAIECVYFCVIICATLNCCELCAKIWSVRRSVFDKLQEEFNDLEDVKIGPGGSNNPVTSQPTAGQAAGAGMPVFAMPAPPNPTNPFANMATENTSLNASDQATYTPGNLLLLSDFNCYMHNLLYN